MCSVTGEEGGGIAPYFPLCPSPMYMLCALLFIWRRASVDLIQQFVTHSEGRSGAYDGKIGMRSEQGTHIPHISSSPTLFFLLFLFCAGEGVGGRRDGKCGRGRHVCGLGFWGPPKGHSRGFDRRQEAKLQGCCEYVLASFRPLVPFSNGVARGEQNNNKNLFIPALLSLSHTGSARFFRTKSPSISRNLYARV